MKKYFLVLLSLAFVDFKPVFSQDIAATLDFCNFKANDSLALFEYYLSFPANSLKHKKTTEGKLQCEINVNVGMVKNGDTVFYDNYVINSTPSSEMTLDKEEYLSQHQIIIPNGEYIFFMNAKDMLNENERKINVDRPVKVGYGNSFIQISDLQNLKSYKPTNHQGQNSKNGIEMVSRNSNFFSAAQDKFIFYVEVYNAANVMNQGETYLLEGRIVDTKSGKIIEEAGFFKKLKAENVNPVLAEVDLSKVPSGDYNIILEIKDRENRSLFSREKYFERYHPAMNPVMEETTEISLDSSEYDPCMIAESINMKNLNFLLNGLMPLAKTNERSFAEAVTNSGDEKQKINFLCYFFQKRETQDKDARTLFLEYKERLEIVEKKYSTQTMPGYQTDRGRVYIQYGKPNRIDDEFSDMSRQAINNAIIPYEIWIYYAVTEPQAQSNVQFVFAQTNRANYNYEIVHSTAIGEYRNPNWKEEISGKMMFNEDQNNDYR